MSGLIAVDTIRAVPEGEAGSGVGPGDLTVRPVVPKRPRRDRTPEPADVRLPVITCDDNAECAIRRHARVAFWQMVADVAGSVGEYVGSPHLAGIVQHRLVVEGKVTCPHEAATTGNAKSDGFGRTDFENRFGRDFRDR